MCHLEPAPSDSPSGDLRERFCIHGGGPIGMRDTTGSRHQQSEYVYIINHCDLTVCDDIPLFLYHFCLCSTPSNWIISAHTCTYSCGCIYIFFQEINHCSFNCVHWCSVYRYKDPPHIPKYPLAFSGIIESSLLSMTTQDYFDWSHRECNYFSLVSICTVWRLYLAV